MGFKLYTDNGKKFNAINNYTMNGNKILIYAGSTLIAATKSHEIQTDCDLQEISSPSNGDWKAYIPGRKGWEVNVNYLVLADSNLADLLNIGTTYTLTIKGRGQNSYNVSGSAIMTTCSQRYTLGNLCVGAFRFRGNGALT